MAGEQFPNMTRAIALALKCFQCTICGKEKDCLLVGLCEKHMICDLCAHCNSTCPTCESPLDRSKQDFVLGNASSMLSELRDMQSIIDELQAEADDQADFSAATQVCKKTPSTPTEAAVNKRLRKVHELNKRNKKGETALHSACFKNKLDEVRKLLEMGASCKTIDNARWTPLHEAVLQGNIDMMLLLLDYGADPNVPGGLSFNTPLHEAASNNNLDAVSLLIQYGGRPNQANLFNKTPSQLANIEEIILAMNKVPTVPIKPTNGKEFTVSELFVSMDPRQLIVMAVGLDRSQEATFATLARNMQFQRISMASPEIKNVKVVVTPGDLNVCKVTPEVLTGMTVGAWIVNPNWLDMCKEMNCLADPMPFEIVGLEDVGTVNAPTLARENFQNLLPGLFTGCHIYFYDSSLSLGDGLDRDILAHLVKLGGGTVFTRIPDPENIPEEEMTRPYHASSSSPLVQCSHYLIYHDGLPEPEPKYQMAHIKSLPHTWLLNCFKNFELFDPPHQFLDGVDISKAANSDT